jgi:hypothetical protein
MQEACFSGRLRAPRSFGAPSSSRRWTICAAKGKGGGKKGGSKLDSLIKKKKEAEQAANDLAPGGRASRAQYADPEVLVTPQRGRHDLLVCRMLAWASCMEPSSCSHGPPPPCAPTSGSRAALLPHHLLPPGDQGVPARGGGPRAARRRNVPRRFLLPGP